MLVSIFAVSAMDAFHRQRQATHILSVVKISRDIVTVREALRVELGVSDTAIAEPDAASDDIRIHLFALHFRSTAALSHLIAELTAAAADKRPPALAGILQ